MDATFYPMSEGKKYIIKLKQAPGAYYNLTYTWGWRIHPTRVQVTEKVSKTALDENGIGWAICLSQNRPMELALAATSKHFAQSGRDADIHELERLERVWNGAHELGDTDAVERLRVDDLEVDAPAIADYLGLWLNNQLLNTRCYILYERFQRQNGLVKR